MTSAHASAGPERCNDQDDEIVALSNALKDQVREASRRLRARGVDGEPPSFADPEDLATDENAWPETPSGR